MQIHLSNFAKDWRTPCTTSSSINLVIVCCANLPQMIKKNNFYLKLHSDATSLAESLTTKATQATSTKHLQYMSYHSGNFSNY